MDLNINTSDSEFLNQSLEKNMNPVQKECLKEFIKAEYTIDNGYILEEKDKRIQVWYDSNGIRQEKKIL